jgi:hypothetical protein
MQKNKQEQAGKAAVSNPYLGSNRGWSQTLAAVGGMLLLLLLGLLPGR